MTRERATKKQQELLAFVDAFIKEHGYGPSYREIMSALGYKSVSTVAIHINGLITKGYLNRKDNSPRSLEVATLTAGQDTKKTAQSTVRAEVTLALKHADASQRQILLDALDILGYSKDRQDIESGSHEAAS